jgi:hypothetical protein
VRAPTEDKTGDTKDNFYDESEHVFEQFSNYYYYYYYYYYYMKMLLRDFNTKERRVLAAILLRVFSLPVSYLKHKD